MDHNGMVSNPPNCFAKKITVGITVWAPFQSRWLHPSWCVRDPGDIPQWGSANLSGATLQNPCLDMEVIRRSKNVMVGMQNMRIPRVIWCLDSNLKWRNSMAHNQFFNGNLGRCSTLTDPGQFWIQPSVDTKPSTDWRPTVTTIELLSSQIHQQLDHFFLDILWHSPTLEKKRVELKKPLNFSISEVQRPWRGPLPAFRHVLDKPSWPKDDATGFRPPKTLDGSGMSHEKLDENCGYPNDLGNLHISHDFHLSGAWSHPSPCLSSEDRPQCRTGYW